MKLSTLTIAVFLSLFFVACSSSNENMSKDTMVAQERPANIDENNVGDTSKESPDQTDPTLIEGNLEKNDFKN